MAIISYKQNKYINHFFQKGVGVKQNIFLDYLIPPAIPIIKKLTPMIIAKVIKNLKKVELNMIDF